MTHSTSLSRHVAKPRFAKRLTLLAGSFRRQQLSQRPIFRACLLAAAGLGLGLAFAPFPCRFFAFLALVPLLYCVSRPEQKKTFLWGWFFGTVAAAAHLWWLWFLVVPVERTTRILLNIGVLVLFVYLGLYAGVFASLVRRISLWSAPLVWPLLEFFRSQLQIAFPWDLLGYSMTPWTAFIQPAALGGVYLVSAWVVLINLLILKLLLPGRRRLWAAVLCLTLTLPLLLGRARIHNLPRWFTVAIVQPNVSPLDKGDAQARRQIISDLVRLTREAGTEHPDLILYPETATLLDVTRTGVRRIVRTLADSLDTEIFTGTPLHDERRGTWHNGAVLIRPGTDTIWPRYYKMKLVPFSEKIPYADELPLLRRLIGTSDMGNWDRGWEYTIFEARFGRFSGLICFEAIFPEHCREFCRRGARLLAVVTNDGWFGRILGAQQHAELAVMRAVENGVPMIRSANNGISFIVDPFGRICQRTPLFVQTVLTGDVPRALADTPYRRFGNWFIVVCLLGTLVFAAVAAIRQRQPRKSG
ncbi:MAG: apolipoprotein N-acyltransferase [candidate division WOR-3 bacterium]